MKRITPVIFFVIVAIFTVSSCSMKNHNVGKAVNFHQLTVKNINGKTTMYGSQTDKWFLFQYTITPTDNPDEFLLKGTMDPCKGGAKSFSNLDMAKSRFTLMLSNRSHIIKAVCFIPIGRSLSRSIRFEKKFTYEPEETNNFYTQEKPFYGSAVFWKAYVSG